MRYLRSLITLWLSAVVIAAPVRGTTSTARGQTGTQVPLFRSGTSAVAVDVSVRDKSRKALTGLTANDFIVSDNGVRQEVTEVSFAKRPIDVTIGLDVSASVTGLRLIQLRGAVSQLMGDLGKQDRLKLLLFHTLIYRAVDFTTDVKAVESAMRRVPMGGGTALFDTISVALLAASDPDRRQLVVFFTDGADSASTTPPSTTQIVAQRSRATLTFVVSTGNLESIFGTSRLTMGSAIRPVDPVFGRLAAETGGSVLTVGESGEVASAFRRILDEFRSSYMLFYTPTGVERTGYHTIGVEVSRPGALVQARRGYFGG